VKRKSNCKSVFREEKEAAHFCLGEANQVPWERKIRQGERWIREEEVERERKV